MAFCGRCGASISTGSAFCSSCGQRSDSTAVTASGAAVQLAKASEQTFFQDDDIFVTNTRFVKGRETFAMSGITSVMSFALAPSKKGPIVLIVIGCFLCLIAMQANILGLVIFGAILLGLGIWWLTRIKKEYHVRLMTASGERDAMWSHNADYINNVVSAITQAIVHRG
jgi:hypothetical protein